MYDRILVPTDGSDCARAAADHAITLAGDHGATVHALYVVHLRPSLEPNLEVVLDTLEAVGEEALADIAAQGEAAGVEVVTATREGLPHEEICDYAEREGMDLVVMGTHGRTGIERVVIGSTAERVVRRSTVPVLTVHEE